MVGIRPVAMRGRLYQGPGGAVNAYGDGLLRKTRRASLTGLSPVGSDGLLTTPPLITMVVDPPPSRLIASTAPSSIIRALISAIVIPTLEAGCRPSTTARTIVPSPRTPAAVRG